MIHLKKKKKKKKKNLMKLSLTKFFMALENKPIFIVEITLRYLHDINLEIITI